MVINQHHRRISSNRIGEQLRHSKLHNLDILCIFCVSNANQSHIRDYLFAAIFHREENQGNPHGFSYKRK